MNIDLNELTRFIEEKKTIRNRTLNPGNYKNLNLYGLCADNFFVEKTMFSNLILSHANIRNSRIRQVIFEATIAHNSIMRLCEIEEVSFKGADMSSIVMENCRAQGCSFEQVNFNNASLTDSDFSRSNFKGANLTNTDASFCNMRGVDFRDATLIKTNFRDANLRGADFTGAQLEEVDFCGAYLEGVLFDESFCQAPDRDETDTLAAIVDPVARNIIKTASMKKLLDETQAIAELDNVMQSIFGSNNAKNCENAMNSEIESIMEAVAKTGIGPLMDSLEQKEGQPPAAVKKLIKDLIKNSNLPENATTEDLLSSLLRRATGK